MIRKIELTGKFKKHYKKMISTFNPNDVKIKEDEFQYVIEKLQHDQPLEDKYCDHKLRGYERDRIVRECHLDPDWLLIYEKFKNKLLLKLLDTGTHSDLFK